jgi:glutamate--cysteine ligase
VTSLRTLVEGLFRPPATLRNPGSIGAELELIPVHAATRRRALPVTGERGTGVVEVVRAAASAPGWVEATDAYGAPSWRIAEPAGTGHISFEPGGQIEISSPVFDDAASLVAFLRQTVGALRDAAEAHGIELLTVGVDPYNPIDDVPLVLHAPRYDRMTAHFERIGPSGVRMMRQTASLQLNVELGARPLDRWRLFNALAPYLVAAFATSSEYAGAETRYASYRAHLWQTLDASRTGLPYDADDPVGAYHRFAVGAGRILGDDAAHLTTLFPEVRPRGYFELRSLDAMPLDAAERAIRMVHALVTDDALARAALDTVGEPDAALLGVAARDGLRDATIRARVEALLALTAPDADAATATSRSRR